MHDEMHHQASIVFLNRNSRHKMKQKQECNGLFVFNRNTFCSECIIPSDIEYSDTCIEKLH